TGIREGAPAAREDGDDPRDGAAADEGDGGARAEPLRDERRPGLEHRERTDLFGGRRRWPSRERAERLARRGNRRLAAGLGEGPGHVDRGLGARPVLEEADGEVEVEERVERVHHVREQLLVAGSAPDRAARLVEDRELARALLDAALERALAVRGPD